MKVLTKNIVWSNYLSAPLECPSFTLVRKPLVMPVVPTVAPPPSSFCDGGSRPTTGARRGGCAVREGREPQAGTACRARAGVARATRRGCRGVAGGAVRRDRRGGRRDARDAGRPGGRRRDGGGGAPVPTTRVPASGSRPGAARATWWAGRGGRGATTPRERHHERGALRAGIGRRGRGATARAPSALASRSPGRHVRRKPDGSRAG